VAVVVVLLGWGVLALAGEFSRVGRTLMHIGQGR
jgi:hypothetical protein